MTRPVSIWIRAGLALLLVVGVMAWVTYHVLALDAREAAARADAAWEESIRLALWRMESDLAQLAALENSRPHGHYRAIYSPVRPLTPLYERIDRSQVWLESPLIRGTPPRIVLHFEIDPAGRFSSPQAPESPTLRELVTEVHQYRTRQAVERDAERLLALAAALDRGQLLATLPAAGESPVQLTHDAREDAVASAGLAKNEPEAAADDPAAPSPSASKAQLAEAVQRYNRDVQYGYRRAVGQQALRNEAEQLERRRIATNAGANYADYNGVVLDEASGRQSQVGVEQQQNPSTEAQAKADADADGAGKIAEDDAADDQVKDQGRQAEQLPGRMAQQPAQQASGPTAGMQAEVASTDRQGEQLALSDEGGSAVGASADSAASTATVRIGVMRAVWVGESLILARQAAVGDEVYVQGCVLDWPGLSESLRAQIGDLLPDATLEPARDGQMSNRRLATLPIELVPGPPPAVALSGWTPIRTSVAVAWVGVLAGSAAVLLLLRGAVVLSERRGAFVSSVTHELRTPLTTFRMYTEMLSGGMVDQPEQRQVYLDTLSTEAERLSHLVENVLSYARLERGRASARVETQTVDNLLGRMSDRLGRRAGQAGLELLVDVPAEAAELHVTTDITAVEQILFNLVDNAAKYASSAKDRRVHLAARSTGDQLVLSVRDHGPGVAAEDRGRLFQPFHKSAHQAAASAPGVGLGLALSRRLARQLGGKLTLGRSDEAGAVFELSIPLKRGEQAR